MYQNSASGFLYVEGCWTCSWWTLSGTVSLCLTTSNICLLIWKTRDCQCSFRLLMMGGVSPETCWPSYKYGIMKFWYIVASCWIFLYEPFWYSPYWYYFDVACNPLAVWRKQTHEAFAFINAGNFLNSTAIVRF